jgi:hypothetical protein
VTRRLAACFILAAAALAACSGDSDTTDDPGEGASSMTSTSSTSHTSSGGHVSTTTAGSGGDASAAGGAQAEGGAGGGGGADEGGAGGGEIGAGDPCSVDGNPGTCLDTSTCAEMPGYESTAGLCPGPADVQCCALTPDVADNPPTPAGYEPMMDSEVTPDMTTWAVMILDDPADYPMFSTALKDFGALMVLARVEWHPPDFQNSVVHRGVTLYEPL